MGIAILSGVIASMDSSIHPFQRSKWESHTSGTSTPFDFERDPSLPRRFIACVNRRQTADQLKANFRTLSHPIEVVAGRNLDSVHQADVVILW